MVKVKFWLPDGWARLEAAPPATDMSARVNVAGSIGSPKSTVTVTDAALVGEAASVDRVGPGAVLSKVTLSTLDAVLPLPAGSVTLPARMEAVTSPSADGVMVKVKIWLPDWWDRDEAVPPVTATSSLRSKVAALMASPKSTVTVTEAALVGDAAVVLRVGAGRTTSPFTVTLKARQLLPFSKTLRPVAVMLTM